MARDWFYQSQGEALGPFSAMELRERAARGEIKPQTRVRQGRTGEWLEAARFPGIFVTENHINFPPREPPH